MLRNIYSRSIRGSFLLISCSLGAVVGRNETKAEFSRALVFFSPRRASSYAQTRAGYIFRQETSHRFAQLFSFFRTSPNEITGRRESHMRRRVTLDSRSGLVAFDFKPFQGIANRGIARKKVCRSRVTQAERTRQARAYWQRVRYEAMNAYSRQQKRFQAPERLSGLKLLHGYQAFIAPIIKAGDIATPTSQPVPRVYATVSVMAAKCAGLPLLPTGVAFIHRHLSSFSTSRRLANEKRFINNKRGDV